MLPEIRWHAPAVIRESWDDPLRQVRQRVELGYHPLININSGFSGETATQLAELLHEGKLTATFTTSFPMTNDPDQTERRAHEAAEHEHRIDFMASVIDASKGMISTAFETKAGDVIPWGSREEAETFSYVSSFSAEQYQRAFYANVEALTNISVLAERRGLKVVLENRPRFNYGQPQDGNGIAHDPNIRVADGPCAQPVELGTFMGTAREIQYICREANCLLAFDVEHATHVEPFSVFHLDNYQNPIKYSGDLTEDERVLLHNLGIEYGSADTVFNYTDMTDEEFRFIEHHGFLLRVGQPAVTRRRTTIQDQLSDLAEGVNIVSYTPGMQTHQGVRVTQDGQDAVYCLSHLPGFDEVLPWEYLPDEQIRERMEDEVALLHSMVISTLVGEANSVDLVLEPKLAYGDSVIYEGPEWERQMEIMKYIVTDNYSFALSKRPGTNTHVPFHFW